MIFTGFNMAGGRGEGKTKEGVGCNGSGWEGWGREGLSPTADNHI